MYQIAICEDEAAILQEQGKVCQDILDKLHIKYHLTEFDNGTDFLASFSKGDIKYDLLLLDIVMDGLDGIELARMIRKADKKATIIFITSNPDFALQGYDVQALHYLLKPVDAEVLKRLIQKDYQDRFENHFVIFESNLQKQKVAVNEIICLETTGRRVEVILLEGSVLFSGKLAELLEKLPADHFVRCHQAFALNIGNIRELTRQDAIAVNGKKIPVSRTFLKDVQKAFMRQLRDG